jgi:tRNA (mo5U34)-methyltransferase
MNTNPARFLNSGPPAGSMAEEAATLGPWFHNLHLPDGTRTAPDHPLGDFPAFKWQQIASHLPERMQDWQVLDIGCNAGFYSLALAKRGARVTALDLDPHFLRQAKWAAEQNGLADRIEFRQGSVYDLAGWSEKFDLILFMGVFYHLRHPLLALDLLRPMTEKLMVFQTLSLPGEDEVEAPADQDFDDRSALTGSGWPKMAFIEHALAGDATNWWVPNHAGIMAMLRSSGFDVVGRPGHEIYLCKPDGPGNGGDVAGVFPHQLSDTIPDLI